MDCLIVAREQLNVGDLCRAMLLPFRSPSSSACASHVASNFKNVKQLVTGAPDGRQARFAVGVVMMRCRQGDRLNEI